jgi:hypothetical protein
MQGRAQMGGGGTRYPFFFARLGVEESFFVGTSGFSVGTVSSLQFPVFVGVGS